jgi:tetratricopeptide (TPR) repeat protein
MLKANTKKVIFILTALTLALAAGCTGPEEKRIQGLNEVISLRAAGDDTIALSKLEVLAESYPNDTTILREIGSIYETLGNTAEAAFYLSAAQRLTPDNIELLYQTYHAQEKANQFEAARELLETLALVEPSALDDELWIRLGELRAEAQQPKVALDAYLKAVDPENQAPSASTAAAIGTLFKQLDNLPQAERWLKIAANSDDPNALTGLLGLTEIHLRKQKWAAAETVINQLDKQFPGALDASQWASARGELDRWRVAQETMQAELAKSKAAAAATSETATVTDSDSAATTLPLDETATGKAEVIANMEMAEAFANTPALEALPPESSTATDTPNADSIAVGSETAELDSTNAPLSLQQLIANAETASMEHDYKKAIQLYWEALGRANNQANIWNQLSLAYRLDGQVKNAETTALEATRLAPEKIDYTLDYLRTIQRTKKPVDFIAELEGAYDRFPRSPEITLSLARAYERINGNNSTAIVLYNRFIDLAPNHPLRAEAETALDRLR